MSNSIDFADVKEKVGIVDALQLLGIEMQIHGSQLRGPCPLCQSGGKRDFVVTPGRNLFYCFAEKKGGDVLNLVSRFKDITIRDAAQFLLGEEPTKAAPAAPQEQKAGTNQPTSGLKALDYLEHEHEAVIAVGFDTRVAKELGIGYSPKGIMRGTVAVPIRDEDGTLVAYIGITEATLPKSLQPPENVVALANYKKKA